MRVRHEARCQRIVVGERLARERRLHHCLDTVVGQLVQERHVIGIQIVPHPLAARPALGLDASRRVALKVETRAGKNQALNVNIVGVEQQVKERVHIVALGVVGKDGTSLELLHE